MDIRCIQTMENDSFHEYLREKVATANNLVTFKNVIEKSMNLYSDTPTNTLGLLMGRLRIRFITP
jgi:hypothetical protein